MPLSVPGRVPGHPCGVPVRTPGEIGQHPAGLGVKFGSKGEQAGTSRRHLRIPLCQECPQVRYQPVAHAVLACGSLGPGVHRNFVSGTSAHATESCW